MFLTGKLFLKVVAAIIIISCLSTQNVKADPNNNMSLTQTEIDQKITDIPEWKQEGQTLTRTLEFKDFVEAIAFVDKLVEPAETAGHHPDIAISYNKVTISLTTHDAGGLTQMDFDLAQTISDLAG